MRLAEYRGKWAVVWSEGGATKRRSLGTSDRGEAERRFADFRAGLSRGGGATVRGRVEAYAADLEARGKSSERLRDAYKNLAETFGRLRPDQVDRESSRRYAEVRRARGASDGTIRTELGRLSSALKGTEARVELPQAPAPRERFLTRDEFKALRGAAVSDHVKVFVTLALATAARKGALLALTWDRVDFERGRIDLGRGVGNKGRGVRPMTASAREALSAAYAGRTCEFVIEYGGRGVKSIDMAFRRTVERAGIEKCSPHDLRRTAGRFMVEAGVSMDLVAQYLDHTSTAVTRRVYARFSPDYMAEAAAALEA